MLVGIGFCIHSIVGFALCGAAVCGLICSSLFWLIMGLVWRFDDYGKFAAGALVPNGISEEEWDVKTHEPDSLYQTNSGMFMKIYYIFSLVMLLLPIMICCGMCCVMCITGTAFKSDYSDSVSTQSRRDNNDTEDDEKEKEPLNKEHSDNDQGEDDKDGGDGGED